MTVAKLKSAAMELEIKNLEKAVWELTHAVTKLTASIQAFRSKESHIHPAESSTVSKNATDVPKTVCSETQCGAINSETITCDHTLARYRSEYDCG